MKELRIRYKGLIFWHNRKVRIPESWHEMTSSQFLAACKLYQKQVDELTFIYQFFNLPKKHLSDFEMYKLFSLVEFVRDCREPHNDFFLQVLPNTDYHAPASKLKGMCLQQFMTADTYFSRYAISENEQFLDLMIASLYLPEGSVFIRNTEIQVPSLFKKMPVLLNMDESLKVVKRLDKTTKFAIFMNFILIKSWLGRMFPHLFPSSGESSTSNLTKPKPVDWLEIFDSFVGDHVADMSKYQRMETMDAFRVMNKRIKDAMKK